MIGFYRICVFKNDYPLFETEYHSAKCESAARRIYELFLERFPTSESYFVKVTFWTSFNEFPHCPDWAR